MGPVPYRRLLRVGLLLMLVVAIGLWYATKTRRAPPAAPVPRTAERTDRVRNWLSQPAVELQSAELDKALDLVMANGSCISAPSESEPLALATMSDAQKADLKLAIGGLLHAYSKNDSDSVFDYMASRQERWKKGECPMAKQELVATHGMKMTDLDSMTDKEVFGLWWSKSGFRSHWQRLIQDSGCVRLWRTSKVADGKVFDHLGQDEVAVFKNIVRFAHLFEPVAGSVEETQRKYGTVTFADVKLIIQYDNARWNEPRPLYFRLWLDPATDIWHPKDLVLIPTVDGSYPFMVF
jgi:hypothetical protein